MSKYILDTVDCPHCGYGQEVKAYVSVNADRMRSVTDSIIDGSWERVTCESCGEHFTLDHRMLYTDLPMRRWIVQHPWAERDRFVDLELEAEQVFRLEYLERPPEFVRAQARDVAPRICFGRGELAEKLMLWREAFDDRALEACKLVLLRNHIDQLFPLGPAEFQLIAATPDRLEFVLIALGSGTALDRFAVPAAEYHKAADDLDAFRPAYPELFDHAYVNASRYLQ